VALSAKEIKGRMAGLPTVKPDQCLVDLGWPPDAEKAYRAIWSLVGQSERGDTDARKVDRCELCGARSAG